MPFALLLFSPMVQAMTPIVHNDFLAPENKVVFTIQKILQTISSEFHGWIPFNRSVVTTKTRTSFSGGVIEDLQKLMF